MKNVFAIFCLCVAMTALTACNNGNDGGVTSDPGTGVNRPASSTTTTTSRTTPAPANPTFGQTYTFENGLEVTVSAPQPYTPTASAAGADASLPAIAFDVTVVNGSPENYETMMFSTTLQSGNQEASEIYDTGGIGGSPSTITLPGRESAFRIAYAVTNPADLVMQVSPGFEYEKIIFTS
ncbi:MAG: hypothetical protein EOO27_16950 [Comamonadaceae bacterium]|jgi:hypothetical protein|nr:MAG: hypothetical protein EOO27_16950 [Comamonadaceae bacterium]